MRNNDLSETLIPIGGFMIQESENASMVSLRVASTVDFAAQALESTWLIWPSCATRNYRINWLHMFYFKEMWRNPNFRLSLLKIVASTTPQKPDDL